MQFIKNTEETLRVTDSNPPFQITHKYFKLRESDYPFDSLQFKELLQHGKVSVLKIDKGFEFLSKYLVQDEQIEAVKKEEKTKHDKRQKEEEKKHIKITKAKEKAEEKKEFEKQEAERKRLENVVIIKDTDIEDSVAKHLLG